jgi:hypothetical protein
MARESRAVWAKRVERWRESGLRATEFAAELGVNAATLTQWKYRLAAEARAEMPSAPAVPTKSVAFVEMNATADPGVLAPAATEFTFEVAFRAESRFACPRSSTLLRCADSSTWSRRTDVAGVGAHLDLHGASGHAQEL